MLGQKPDGQRLHAEVPSSASGSRIQQRRRDRISTLLTQMPVKRRSVRLRGLSPDIKVWITRGLWPHWPLWRVWSRSWWKVMAATQRIPTVLMSVELWIWILHCCD